MPSKKSIKKRGGEDFTNQVFITAQQFNKELAIEVESTTTINTDYLDIMGVTQLALLLEPTANYSASDSITVNMYRYISEGDRYSKIGTESISLSNTSANESGKNIISIADVEFATHVTISGTLTISTGAATLSLVGLSLF
jgi:hypothetical protein